MKANCTGRPLLNRSKNLYHIEPALRIYSDHKLIKSVKCIENPHEVIASRYNWGVKLRHDGVGSSKAATSSLGCPAGWLYDSVDSSWRL